jgi:hypothetical protein
VLFVRSIYNGTVTIKWVVDELKLDDDVKAVELGTMLGKRLVSLD